MDYFYCWKTFLLYFSLCFFLLLYFASGELAHLCLWMWLCGCVSMRLSLLLSCGTPRRKVATPASADDADFSFTTEPTPVMLFRYSALTFNSHLIHYNHPYTQEVGNASLPKFSSGQGLWVKFSWKTQRTLYTQTDHASRIVCEYIVRPPLSIYLFSLATFFTCLKLLCFAASLLHMCGEQEEGYADILVHGPLTHTLLLDALDKALDAEVNPSVWEWVSEWVSRWE